MSFFTKLFGNTNSAGAEISKAVADGALLVDVRSESEFRSGSVSGSVNIPVDQITLRLNELKGKSGIVVFCRSGNRSRMAKSILEGLGIKNIIDGGTWQSVNEIVSKSK